MIRMKNIVFIGGIHGVGKTSFSEAICRDLGLVHITASSLIGSFKESKRVKNIPENQEILVEAVNDLDSTGKYLLDGHFCLLSKDGQIQTIEVDVFNKLSLMAIIVLQEKVETIQDRLSKRDNHLYTLEFLNDFQEKELKQAKQVSDSLNIRMQVISPSNRNDEIPAEIFL